MSYIIAGIEILLMKVEHELKSYRTEMIMFIERKVGKLTKCVQFHAIAGSRAGLSYRQNRLFPRGLRGHGASWAIP